MRQIADIGSLVEQAQAGDVRAQEKLLKRVKPIVYSWAKKFAYIDPDDATQITLLKIWKSIPKYDPAGGDFEAYTNRIARNKVIDLYRKAKRRAKYEAFSIDAPDRTGRPHKQSIRDGMNSNKLFRNPFEDALNAEFSEEMHHLLEHICQRLPKAGEQFMLRVRNEYTYEEISKATGAKVGSVKKNIFDARKSANEYRANNQRCSEILSPRYSTR